MLRNGLENVRRFRDVGADAVYSASDMADNSVPFFKPKLVARFIAPFLNGYAEECRAIGLRLIFHTDVFLPPDYVEKIASTGVNGLQAIDPIAGMDMRSTKDVAAGRLCLCGNVDCGLLVAGTPDEVYAASRDLLETCRDGGAFVFGASNAVQSEVPTENYLAQIQAWRDFGQY